MGKSKVDKEQVKQAITAANAMKTGVCEVLGISRPTLDKYLRDNKDLQEFFDFTRHKQIDRAEYKLFDAVEKGEAWAIQFLLKSKRGRERGYGETLDLNPDEGLKVTFTDARNNNRTAQNAQHTGGGE